MNPRKYLLKPGKHQFAPGEHARHDNNSITDAEAEWYMKRYPHIAKLFIIQQKNTKPATRMKKLSVLRKSEIEKSEIKTHEDLSATN